MFVICGTQHWRAELPPGWCAQHGPNNVAIYHPDGVGAVQVSSFRKPQGTVAEADLQEAVRGHQKRSGARRATTGTNQITPMAISAAVHKRRSGSRARTRFSNGKLA